MEMGKPRLARSGDGLGVHVCQHQQRASAVIDSNGGYQTGGIELRHELAALLTQGRIVWYAQER